MPPSRLAKTSARRALIPSLDLSKSFFLNFPTESDLDIVSRGASGGLLSSAARTGLLRNAGLLWRPC